MHVLVAVGLAFVDDGVESHADYTACGIQKLYCVGLQSTLN